MREVEYSEETGYEFRKEVRGTIAALERQSRWAEDGDIAWAAEIHRREETSADAFEVLLSDQFVFAPWDLPPRLVEDDDLGKARAALAESNGRVKAADRVSHPWFTEPVAPVIADFPSFFQSLIGPGAVVGGSGRHLAMEVLRPWLVEDRIPSRDRNGLLIVRDWWRYPGRFLGASAEDHMRISVLAQCMGSPLTAMAAVGKPMAAQFWELKGVEGYSVSVLSPVASTRKGSTADQLAELWESTFGARRFASPVAALAGVGPAVRHAVRCFAQATFRLMNTANVVDDRVADLVVIKNVVPYLRDVLQRGVDEGGEEWRWLCRSMAELLSDLPAEEVMHIVETVDMVRRDPGLLNDADEKIGDALVAAMNEEYIYTCRLWYDKLSRLHACLPAQFGAAAEPPLLGAARFHHLLMNRILPGSRRTKNLPDDLAATIRQWWDTDEDAIAECDGDLSPSPDDAGASTDARSAAKRGVSAGAGVRAFLDRIVGQPALVQTLEQIAVDAQTPVRLLVAGPPGTGRGRTVEALARIVSERRLRGEPAVIEAKYDDTTTAWAAGDLQETIENARGKRLLVIQNIDRLLRADPGALQADLLDRALRGARSDLAVVAFAGPDGGQWLSESYPSLLAQFETVATRDLSPSEMLTICREVADETSATVSDDGERALSELLSHGIGAGELRNGRLARAITEAAVGAARRRDPETPRPEVLAEDIPAAERYSVDGAGEPDPIAALDALVGLSSVKNVLRRVVKEIVVAERRREAGVDPGRRLCPDMVFLGETGSGKTLVARVLARILHRLGVLSTRRVTIVGKDDLVGDTSDQTRSKTSAVMDNARGTILFIDDVGSLENPDWRSDPGRAALPTIVDRLDEMNDGVVILAGAPGRTDELLGSGSGVVDTFPTVLSFPNYSPKELVAIFRGKAAQAGLTIGPGVEDAARRSLSRTGSHGVVNGRAADLLLRRAMSHQAARLADAPEADADAVRQLIADDIPGSLTNPTASASVVDDDPMATLESLIGLTPIKSNVRSLVASAKADQKYREFGMELEPAARHMIFTGNPGTAKTTVARLLGGIYKDLGLLSSGHLVEVSRKELVGEYIGHTEPKVAAVLQRAMGGVLFIDEAYLLNTDSERDFGHEAIGVLLQEMENRRGDLVVVAAGYPDKMRSFLDMNPGLASRFPYHLEFPDYSDGELVGIFGHHAKKMGFTVAPDLAEQLRDRFEGMPRDKNFGNGRAARTLLEKIKEKHDARIVSSDNLTHDEIRTLTVEDLPPADVPTPPERRSIGFMFTPTTTTGG